MSHPPRNLQAHVRARRAVQPERSVRQRAGRIETPQETEIVAELSRDHLTMLWSRRTANVVRRNRYQLTSLISMPTVLVIAAELIVAVAARLE